MPCLTCQSDMQAAQRAAEYPRSSVFFLTLSLAFLARTGSRRRLAMLALLSLPILSKCPRGSRPASVENKGFEPLTPSLQSWCSSQLS